MAKEWNRKVTAKLPVPAHLDLHYVTNNLLAASAPVPSQAPTYTDSGRDEKTKQVPEKDDDNDTASLELEALLERSQEDHPEPLSSSSRHDAPLSSLSSPSRKRQRPSSNNNNNNSAASLLSFLDQRHSGSYMIFSFVVPEDRTLLLFRRQIVQLPPPISLHNLLVVCYTLHAWLSVDPDHVAVIWCENGRTHTVLAAAAYLVYTQQVATMQHGFKHALQVLRRRHKTMDDDDESLLPPLEQVVKGLPPSLLQLFRNFDTLLELGQCVNTKPLVLRAVALQCVPLEDPPILQVWEERMVVPSVVDSSSSLSQKQTRHRRLLYSSVDEKEDSHIWIEEDGFYPIDCIVQGDFTITCRFGMSQQCRKAFVGDDDDENNVSTLIFHYNNTTGFIGAGIYELPVSRVDVMPQYQQYFDDHQEVLLTMVFESYWDSNKCHGSERDSILRQECGEHILPQPLYDQSAAQEGWWLITQHHSAQPNEQDINRFLEYLRATHPEMYVPKHLVSLALQLYNFHHINVLEALTSGRFRSWWENDEQNEEEAREENVCGDCETDQSYSESLDQIDAAWTVGSSAGNHVPATDIYYQSAVMFPRPGDVVHALEPLNIPDMLRSQQGRIIDQDSQPMFPYLAKDNQRRPLLISSQMDNPKHQPAVEMLMRLQHPNVNLEDLLHLQKCSQEWNPHLENDSLVATGDAENNTVLSSSDTKNDVGRPAVSVLNLANPHEKPVSKDDQVVEDPQIQGQDVSKLSDQVESHETEMNDHRTLESSTGVPLKDDPEWKKYFQMLSVGLPREAVRHSMTRDGKDLSVLDLDPTKSLRSQTAPSQEAVATEEAETETDTEIPLKDDPEWKKYFQMLSVGLPKEAAKHAMTRDGKDPSVLDLDQTKSLRSQTAPNQEVSTVETIPLKDDPEWKKYFQMISMGLPKEAAKHAMMRDGKDPSVLDLDPTKSLLSQSKCESVPPCNPNGVALRDEPEWKEFFRRLETGAKLEAIKIAVARAGKDPKVMDLDPNRSLAAQRTAGSQHLLALQKKTKKPVRRKKIHWNPIVDPKQVPDDSIWSKVKNMDTLKMSSLKYDQQEFADLFTESTEQSTPKNSITNKTSPKSSKSLQVIDGKRSMNGGIVLLRLKMDYGKIASMVDNMEDGELDTTQLNALKEFLPTAEERQSILNHMKSHGSTDEEIKSALTGFSECEKYMYTMLDVVDAAAKIDCLLFRVQFKQRVDELLDGARVVDQACDEVMSSTRLQRLMALILTLVNHINTGGDGSEAIGFSLDALLKLNEAKAFDRKTTVLQYLYKVVKDNDQDVCDFSEDLVRSHEACEIIFENIFTDLQALHAELTRIKETAKNHADQMDSKGVTEKLKLSELKEQRSILPAPHYNHADLLGGRTAMERFVNQASNTLEKALEFSSSVKLKYGKLLQFMCEDESMRANEFFGIMRQFILAFNKAGEQIESEEKARIRAQKRDDARRTSNNSKEETLIGDKTSKSDGITLAALIATSAMKKKAELGKASKNSTPTTDDGKRSLSTEPIDIDNNVVAEFCDAPNQNTSLSQTATSTAAKIETEPLELTGCIDVRSDTRTILTTATLQKVQAVNIAALAAEAASKRRAERGNAEVLGSTQSPAPDENARESHIHLLPNCNKPSSIGDNIDNQGAIDEKVSVSKNERQPTEELGRESDDGVPKKSTKIFSKPEPDEVNGVEQSSDDLHETVSDNLE